MTPDERDQLAAIILAAVSEGYTLTPAARRSLRVRAENAADDAYEFIAECAPKPPRLVDMTLQQRIEARRTGVLNDRVG